MGVLDVLRGAATVGGAALGGYAEDQKIDAARVIAAAKAKRDADNDAVLNRIRLAGIDPTVQRDLAGAKVTGETPGLVDRAKQMTPIKVEEQTALIPGKVAEQAALTPGKVDEATRTAGAVAPIHTAQAVATAKGVAPVQEATHAANRQFDVDHPTAPEKAPNDGERKGAAFVHRVIPAGQLVNQFDERKALDAIAAKAGMLGNWASSSEGQKLRQAGEQWVYSVLRPESGAAISPKEFESYEKTYLPTPFDDDGTLAQKRQARRTAEESVAIQAGRALPKDAFTSAVQADSAAAASRRPPGYRP